jgi:hypothetical protein
MAELATELPPESLSAGEVERLRERPAVRSVIELPSGHEHRRNATSTVTVLVGQEVLYLTLDAESGRWRQHTLAYDADERELLEVTLDQLGGGDCSPSNG